MSRSRMCVRSVLLLAALMSLAGCTREKLGFTADVIKRADFSKVKDESLRSSEPAEFRTQLYVKGDMEREDVWEMAYVEDKATGKRRLMALTKGKPAFSIVGMLSKSVYWSIHPRTKTYFEARPHVTRVGPEFKGWKYVGRARIQGFECKKYSRSSERESGTVTETWWWAPELGYQIKTESSYADGHSQTNQLTNIVRERLPDSLFRVPRGYKKLTLHDGAS
jgi:hypothetical protein